MKGKSREGRFKTIKEDGDWMPMNPRKRNRIIIIAAAGVVLAGAAGLSLYALNDQIVFFKSPSDIASEGLAPGTRVRIGGLVKEGSWTQDGTSHVFAVTDTAQELVVAYTGILPDLFREGQGVVLDGALTPEGRFVADTVLAKHDENYMPAEVAEALKAQGHWIDDQGNYGKADAAEPAKP
jgi:cytochrome c-type biogenesis protein CcmE